MIEVATGPLPEGTGDQALVVPVHTDLVWGPGAGAAVEGLGPWVETYLRGDEFTGKPGQVISLPGEGAGFGRVVLVGLGGDGETGPGTEVGAETLRRAAAVAAGAVTGHRRVATTLHQLDVEGAADAVTEGFALGGYRYREHLTAEPPPATDVLHLVDAVAGAGGRGLVIAEAVAAARDLVNRPANFKSPERIAGWAADELGAAGVDVEIWDEERIGEERLGALQAVAWGAATPPRLVRAHHRPASPVARIALVGKGIVFDSGGLSLKTPDGMTTMKTDMAGAATVLAAIRAIARLDIPVEVIGFVPLTENMPGGAALRPGDVITARNGTTIEVLNTDAEGRLVLADGLVLATETGADLIVDVATLTGACKVALGTRIAGLFASDDDVAARLEGAASSAGEPVWRLPLEDEARSKLDSKIADLKNLGDRWGGAGTAALFLRDFTSGAPWAHLDIAGPARVDKPEHYLTPGASGFGVRTLVALAERATSTADGDR